MAAFVPSSQLKGVWKTLSDDRLFLTLKFGFHQKSKEYRLNDRTSILDQLYHDAEEWLRTLRNNACQSQISGSYTFYLFRIPTSDFTLIPILRQSDIEQNCLIEIILVPAETNLNPHSLYRCQLNVPTNCSRCKRFIAGVYRQGLRCRKCRRTFHKTCGSQNIDDCPVDSNDEQPARRTSSSSSMTSLTLFNSHPTEIATSVDDRSEIGVPRTTTTTNRAEPEAIEPNRIIERGIFPACIRGSNIARRFLFRLTTTILSISSNLTQANIEQIYLTHPNDGETFFALTDIRKLVLTHQQYDRTDVFEIHFNDRTILSIGKRTDSDELQMETAQFYSSIREQRATLINASPPTPPPSMPPPPPPTTDRQSQQAAELSVRIREPERLGVKPSNYSIAPKDLYELYQFTGENIGQGAFGRVVGARKKSNQENVAVKIIEKANCDELEMIRINGEINNLYKFNHVNILKLQAYYERDEAVYLVTERMETDLCKYIMSRKPHPNLDERVSRMIIYQLIVAVRYLHSQNCGHLDIKCDNILLTLLKPRPPCKTFDTDIEYPLVKLADFGYSRIIGEHSFRKTRVGTRVYNAPEVNHGTIGYNRLADMWSIGMVMFAALSGQLPYDEIGSQNAEQYVRDEKILFSSQRWKDVSPEAKDLILNKLLVVSSSSRITSNNAIFEAWFTDLTLCIDLREIERRTAYLAKTRGESLPTSSHWLTNQREDEIWMEFLRIIAESEKSS